MAGGAPLKKGRGNSGLVLSSHGRVGGSCKTMNRAGKEKFCREEADLILQTYIFGEKV